MWRWIMCVANNIDSWSSVARLSASVCLCVAVWVYLYRETHKPSLWMPRLLETVKLWMAHERAQHQWVHLMTSAYRIPRKRENRHELERLNISKWLIQWCLEWMTETPSMWMKSHTYTLGVPWMAPESTAGGSQYQAVILRLQQTMTMKWNESYRIEDKNRKTLHFKETTIICSCIQWASHNNNHVTIEQGTWKYSIIIEGTS